MNHIKKPLALTIVIPAYNEAGIIGDCLDQIAAQTIKPNAVVIVDNNSTDETAKIAKSYKFVRMIKEPVQGIVQARNAGFEAVKEGIIARIDADTILPNDWVETVLEYYSLDQNLRTVITGRGYFTNVAFPSSKFWLFMSNLFVFRLNRFIAGHFILWGSNMALPVKLWKDVKSETCLLDNIHEDLDLAIHLNSRGTKIVYKSDLIVGVEMKRVFSNWRAVYGNLMWWPRTFRVHGSKRWVVGAVGAYFLLLMSIILIITNKPIFYLREISFKRISNLYPD